MQTSIPKYTSQEIDEMIEQARNEKLSPSEIRNEFILDITDLLNKKLDRYNKNDDNITTLLILHAFLYALCFVINEMLSSVRSSAIYSTLKKIIKEELFDKLKNSGLKPLRDR